MHRAAARGCAALASRAFALPYHLHVVRALGLEFAKRDLEAVPDPLAETLEPSEGGLFDDGIGEGGHRVSHNARSGTAKKPSPKLAVISPS